MDYAALAARGTQLHTRGPSTGSQRFPPTPEGLQQITITSGDLALRGWLALPASASPSSPVPGLVYFHGAFSLKPADAEAMRPALDAGFAVLWPSLRGENGNPGALELLAGEVDDGVAAIRTLADHPAVDPARVSAFGHSVGGALAALVSLRADAPLHTTGSVGGIYVPQTFVRWSKMSANRGLIRFDPTDPRERNLRSLLPHVADMVHEHHAFIGDDDRWFIDNAAAVAEAAQAAGVARFVVHRVPGDHASSVGPAVTEFLRVLTDASGTDTTAEARDSTPAPSSSPH